MFSGFSKNKMSTFDLNSPDLHTELVSILSKKDTNLFKKLEFTEFLTLFKATLPERLLVAEILTEILRKQEVSINDLLQIKVEDLTSLLSMVGDNLSSNTIVIIFIITLHGQLQLKQDNIKYLAISALLHEDLNNQRADVAHAIVHVYNRIEQDSQPLMIDLLISLYQNCPEYFYTNDNTVIFDITLRELMREGDRCEMLKLLVLVLESIPVS
jgi:hypothetical protein